MRLCLLLPVLLIAVRLIPGADAAPKADKPQKECPHAMSDGEAIVKDMAAAPTCSAALELFQACARGSSGDAEYGDAVTARCEKDFDRKLSRAQRATYAAEHRACDRKYRNQQGTMYISFTAFCHAELAAKYSLRFSRAPAAK
jgi:hypothetical protein